MSTQLVRDTIEEKLTVYLDDTMYALNSAICTREELIMYLVDAVNASISSGHDITSITLTPKGDTYVLHIMMATVSTYAAVITKLI